MNNVETAAAMVDEVGNSALGICLDAFHYHVGPSKARDLELLTARNLFHVQLCDVADIPRELASDSHRILPGDGEIELQAIVERLRAIDYQQAVSIEVLNPQFWRIPPLGFADVAMSALRRTLRQPQTPP
jgi:sugar phosphate isomerase/epimerase